MINVFNLASEVATTPRLRNAFVASKGYQKDFAKARLSDVRQVLMDILVEAERLGIPVCRLYDEFKQTKKLDRERTVLAREMLAIIAWGGLRMRRNPKQLPIPAIGGAVIDVVMYVEKSQVLRYKFRNGYGASVINNDYSCGWELAVLKGSGDDWKICYDTPITNDVVGYIEDEDELKGLLERISSL